MRTPQPLDPADHRRRPWRVHAIAAAEAMRLLDVWEVDAELPPGATLAQWVDAFQRERPGLLARTLFALRGALGRLLRLDPGGTGFLEVYTEAHERLRRIDNRTVSALLHLSLASRRPRLAVYARPKGWVGRVYLRAIEPFRRHVVYPALLAAGRRAVDRLHGAA